MLNKPKSIADYGGLEAYLNSAAIRKRHNGYGYNDLVKNRDKGATFIRNLFRLKSRETAYRWFRLLDGGGGNV